MVGWYIYSDVNRIEHQISFSNRIPFPCIHRGDWRGKPARLFRLKDARRLLKFLYRAAYLVESREWFTREEYWMSNSYPLTYAR